MLTAFIKRYCKTTSPAYFLLCAALSTLSVLTLVSVAAYGRLDLGGKLGNLRLPLIQMLSALGGLAAMFVVSLLDYRRLMYWRWFHILCWGLVLFTFVPGIGYEPPGTGSRSWIAMPFGTSLQPVELAKISFCLSFASHLERVRGSINRPTSLVPVLLHWAAPVLLVHLQGDDGGAAVFLAMGLVMLLAAGLNRWVVAGSAVAVAGAVPLLWRFVLSSHQKNRIIGLFRPHDYAQTIMYQQLCAQQAIQAGGLWGRGLFQPMHNYVPRAENDFIFSYYAESCGFFGSLLLLALLFGLIFKTLHTAMRATDNAGSFLCTGMFALLLFQTLVNLGMNLMLLPVMGLTLPFLSAGGSSVFTLYICMGLVLSVQRRAHPAFVQLYERNTFFSSLASHT